MLVSPSIFVKFMGIISVMDMTTFKIGRREFVVLPRKRYDQLTRAEEDREDAETAKKGRVDFLDGRMKTISHDEVWRKLGLIRC